jgi:pyruvate,water dikinase
MAVLVQSLIEADAAGVAFTANPMTGASDEIVINAVPGLGEPLSAGRISGDVFVVSRDGAEKSASITAKPFMLTWKGEIALPRERAEHRAITEAEAAAVARLAKRVERLFGCPQDIEFAIASERIYLLQARPITGLPEEEPISDTEIETYLAHERARLTARVEALRRRGRLKGADAIFSNGNVGELLPTPTPMSFGLFRAIFADPGGAIAAGRRMLGYFLDESSAEGLYELICGQVYFNIEIDARTFDIGLPIDIGSILSSIAEDHARASYPEFGLYAQAMSLAEAICAYGESEGQRRHTALWQFHAAMTKAACDIDRRYRSEIEPVLRRSLEPVPPSLLASENAALLALFQQRIDHLRQFSCVWFVAAARIGFYFADMVRWRLGRHLGEPALTQKLFQGLEGSLITRQAIELENLAQGRITCEAFLRAYGHSSRNELEISLPRLSEEPRNIERLLHDLAASGRQPGHKFHEQQRRRRDAERDVRRRLEAQGTNKADLRAFFTDLRLAQTFLPLRETIKHYYTGEYRVLREALLEINRRLGWKDGDIFYLHPSEISGCFHSRESLAALVSQRRRRRKIAALLAGQQRVPPVVFASNTGALGSRPKTLQSRRLKGVPVAPGSAAGLVRVLDDTGGEPWQRKAMRGDEIIVARSANLGLAPLMRMSAGLVVEVGGVLAHAACQARESGIPAVVLAGATSVLQEGMAITIDGATGRIEVLEERTAS